MEHTSVTQAKSVRTSFQRGKRATFPRLRTINQGQPRSTKRPSAIVPPPQSARIMQRYVSGESIRQIAREEHRDRATVTKIVRSDEMNIFVQGMRERLYGLGIDAMDAIQHGLQKQKDARLGYQLLTDIGVVPSPQERCEIATQPVRWTMTPFEAAMTEGTQGQMMRVAYGAACAIEVSSECYGFPLPTPEEVRHSRKVARVADQIADGQFTRICLADGAEEKRIRQLAEQQVKREEARRSLPPGRDRCVLPNEKHLTTAGLARPTTQVARSK